MPTRNGPTRCARRPPTAPNRMSGRAKSVIPRLAIHSAVSRSSRAIDHSASNEPIITHTAQPSRTAPANGRIRSRSNASRCDVTRSSATAPASGRELRTTNGTAATLAAAMTRNGPGMPSGPTSTAATAGPAANPPTSAASRRPRLWPMSSGSDEDDDAAHGRDGHPDADAHHEASAEVGHEVAGRGEHEQAGDVEAHADQHEPPGVAAVGERGDEDLGQEPGEEAHPDHRAELRRRDAVVVADVVEHAEQRAVAHRHRRQHEPERHEHGRVRPRRLPCSCPSR